MLHCLLFKCLIKIEYPPNIIQVECDNLHLMCSGGHGRSRLVVKNRIMTQHDKTWPSFKIAACNPAWPTCQDCCTKLVSQLCLLVSHWEWPISVYDCVAWWGLQCDIHALPSTVRYAGLLMLVGDYRSNQPLWLQVHQYTHSTSSSITYSHLNAGSVMHACAQVYATQLCRLACMAGVRHKLACITIAAQLVAEPA